MRAVIVDDEEDLRALTRYHLELDGIDIIGEAADGVAALEVIRDSDPDVVVVDLAMPRLDGVEVIRRLRAQATTARLVAFSADPASLEVATRAGADAAVVKDGDFDALLTAVRG